VTFWQLAPGALKTRASLRQAGDWSGEERTYWQESEARVSS
jgi:hypothetical protein